MRINRTYFPLSSLVGMGLLIVSVGLARAQTDLPVYTDSLQVGFEDWSWATVDLANAAPVHTGGHSIKVTAKGFEAFRVHATAPLATAFYSSLSFWINGGAAGGQPLSIQATVNGMAQTLVDLGTASANTWVQHTISAAALGLAGQVNFDGFWIQNNSGTDLSASPFFIDDITLIAAAAGGGGQGALSVNAVVSDNGLAARKVQWMDAAGQPRTAVMVDQRQAGAGYLRQFTYKVNGADRVCTGTGDNGHMGDGYVQNHTATGGDNSSHTTPGTTSVVLAGNHHAIISYDMPAYQIDGHTVPTTIQWFFADGRSHPIFALSQDARATPGNLGADTRSPYGDVAYDGGADSTVGGASFGDTYKFATLAAAPEQVTRASGWRYDEPNTIPYAMQWADPVQVDAEMGHVATLPISLQDQGSDSRTSPAVDNRGKQQVNGPMIDDENWSYQILNYVMPANGPTGSKRLTWGSNWGRPGGFDNWGSTDAQNNPLKKNEYSQHSTDPLGQVFSGNRADGMLVAYSVFVVLGTHSGGYKGGTVGQAVSQMENVNRATLSTSVGTVKLSGPAGVGNAASATVNYTPAGYNPIYSTWEVVAAANAVDATLAPAAGTSLDHPIFVVNGYTLAQLPATLSVGPGLATPDVDYFASVDSANQRLWITVNRSISSPVNLVVGSAGGGTPPPIITTIPASGQVGTSVTLVGNNFNGASSVSFNGISASFTVDSATQITAVVPLGATVGPITITTPGGTVTSSGNFTPLAAPPPPPILSVKPGLGSAGLRIVSGPGQYDRQNIATDVTTNDYGWIGSSSPVTYSLTISDFPPEAYRGFQAHLFLVPNATASTAPDYDDPSVVMLDIQAHADGTATAWLRYKINDAGDNGFFYGAGTLGQVDCPTGPLGAWSLSFTSSTAVALGAPNGATKQLNFSDPSAIQTAFGNKITAFFGNQANDPSQVGQASTFGRIQISGTPRAAAIDETFPGSDLNQHPLPVQWQWVKLAAAPSGISVGSTSGLVLNWTLPDTGYSLQFSPSLYSPAWTEFSLANSVVQGSVKLLFIPKSDLPGKTNGFFRLAR